MFYIKINIDNWLKLFLTFSIISQKLISVSAGKIIIIMYDIMHSLKNFNLNVVLISGKL